jgi:hypothetical protein
MMLVLAKKLFGCIPQESLPQVYRNEGRIFHFVRLKRDGTAKKWERWMQTNLLTGLTVGSRFPVRFNAE